VYKLWAIETTITNNIRKVAMSRFFIKNEIGAEVMVMRQ
jgi:hypothetical protein